MILEDSSGTGDFSPAARESGEEIAGGDEKRNLASECGEPGVVSQAEADWGMMGARSTPGQSNNQALDETNTNEKGQNVA